MKNLNTNSNNNKYVQMKQSGLNERSSLSEHSDVLSLTSNNSESMVNNSQNQIDVFKEKISHLLGTQKYQSLQDIYSIIQQKVGHKLIQQTSKQLNGMEAALGRVKKNTKQMAKLVTVLGTKAEHYESKLTKKDKSITKHIEKQKPYNNNIDSQQQNEQFYNYHYQQKQQNKRRPLSKHQQQVNNKKIQSHHQQKNEQRIRYLPRVKQSFEQEYKWKNKIYQQKVKQMLMELKNIKNELNTNHPLINNNNTYHKQTNSNKIQQSNHNIKQNNIYSQQNSNQTQTRNSFAARLFNAQSTHQQQESEINHINFILNPKTAVSQQINQQHINYYQPKHKMSNNNKQTHKGNTFLIEKAKSISKRLQQIKAQLAQTTSRKLLHSVLTQAQQKTNIELLASNNFQTNNKIPQSYKLGELDQQSKQSSPQNKKQIQNSSNEEQEKEQNPVSIDRSYEKVPKHRLNKKKSVLDQMKNVQSKILISQKNIQQSKQNLIANHKRVQTPNFSTFYPSKLPSQNIPKPSISNSLSKSNDKSDIVSYSIINPSGSYKKLPHNTSIMNYQQPSLINKQPSFHVNNSFNYNLPSGPYETSHVFPVTKFNKHKIFQNQSHNSRSSSLNRFNNQSTSLNRIQHPPLIIHPLQSQKMFSMTNHLAPNIKIGRSLSAKNLINNQSFNSPYNNMPQKIVTSPGIRITNMSDSSKAVPYTITLGSSKKNKQINTSKDSKDLTRSKGIGLSSKQNK